MSIKKHPLRRGKRRTHIHTECGHSFRTGYPASILQGCTMDCLHCSQLLIFPLYCAGTAVYAELFHLYMNRQDPQWPADGHGTGWVSF